MDSAIIDFISKHHVMTLATCSGEQPYCANLFYAFDQETNSFFFTTNVETRHGAEALENSQVAASIVLETEVVGIIQGLQIVARAYRPSDQELKRAKKLYLKRFPYAVLMDLEMWVMEVQFAKLTNNKLGFGKKLIWNKNE